MTDYEKIMMILENEHDMEMKCAKQTYQLLIKTKNPFKRAKMKKSIETFMNHCIGMDLVKRAIEKEMRES